MKLSVSTNFPEVQRQMLLLRDDIRGPATARALNRSIDPAKPEMARQIASEFNVTISVAKAQLRVTHARYVGGDLAMSVTLESPSKKGRSLNLIRFVEKTVSLAAARRRVAAGEGGSFSLRNGVTIAKTLELRFKIKRNGPAKVIKGAFIANQGRTVFIREGKSRLPIKALQTIDIGQMFNTKRVNKVVVDSLLQRFPAIWEHEVSYYTDRFNRSRL